MNVNKKWVFLTAIVLLGPTNVNAQVVLKPKFYKFGVVIPGKTYHLNVKIANPTDQTISLWNLRVDCDCTTAHIAQAVLKPKTSTLMNIKYHPMAGVNGLKTFYINFQVYSQDKNKGIRRNMEKFIFTAELHSPYSLDPPILEGGYGLVGHERESHGTLKLDTKTYPQWQPDSAGTSIGGFQAQVKSLATSGVFDVLLSMASTIGIGSYEGSINITGKGNKAEAFQYPFRATVGSLWNITPGSLELGELDPTKLKNWKSSTQVRESYGKPFKIETVEGLPDWLKYHMDKSPVGDILIKWEIDKGKLEKAKNGLLSLELVVKTDRKDEPEFKIAIHGVKGHQTKSKSILPGVTTPSISTSPAPSGK